MLTTDEALEKAELEADRLCREKYGDKPYFDICFSDTTTSLYDSYMRPLWEHVRAARGYFDHVLTRNDKGLQTYAFLSLFHPEMDHLEKREVIRDIENARHA